MSGREVVLSRFHEAVRVREAYVVVLGRHRGAWLAAKSGPDAERERRKYSAALEQAKKAQQDEDDAWREWQELNG